MADTYHNIPYIFHSQSLSGVFYSKNNFSQSQLDFSAGTVAAYFGYLYIRKRSNEKNSMTYARQGLILFCLVLFFSVDFAVIAEQLFS